MTPSHDTITEITKLVIDLTHRDGVCTPDAYHDIVADPDHPLHHRYEWDDTIAGREYRKHQIRRDIVRPKIIAADTETPHFVSVTVTRADNTTRRGYIEQLVAAQTDELWQQVIHETSTQLRSLRNRLAGFRNTEKAIRHLDAALDDLTTDNDPA